jgi:hypothetical protein
MTLVTITPTVLVLGTASASLIDANMTAITSATDGCTISNLSAYHGNQVLLKLEDSVGCTVTFTTGDNPPAVRAGLAAPTVTIGANEVKFIVMELARIMQDDGTIHFVTGTTTSSCVCFILPRGA